MKLVKKLLIFILLFVLSFTLVSCGKVTTTSNTSSSNTAVLPDLTGKTTEEAKQTLDELGVTYSCVVKNGLYYGDSEGKYQYDMFYEYAGKKVGDVVNKDRKFNVYVTAYNLPSSIATFIEENPEYKDEYEDVNLDGKVYTDKSFLKTGCGEVTVTQYVDGDTTHFKDNDGEYFSLRYLGVDTPESTSIFEPWGKAASNYTKECLSSATKIVLTADEAGQTDSNGRYLGWVWYLDNKNSWHLLNLELVLFAYSMDKSSSDSTLGKLILGIGANIGNTGRRIYGESDPDFDYSTDPKVISIEELRTNFGQYYGKKVKITGIIALMDNNCPVIVDPESGYGIYYYTGYAGAQVTYNLEVGNKISIEGVATYYSSSSDETDKDSMDEDLKNGSPQLSGLSSDKQITLISEGNTVSPVELDIANLNVSDIGKFGTISDFTITRVNKGASGLTVTCKNALGKTIALRIDSSNYYLEKTNEDGIDISLFVVGKTITKAQGYLAYYYGYQLCLIQKNDVVIK